MATRRNLRSRLPGDIEDTNLVIRTNPEGPCPDDDNLSDVGTEAFTGLYTDAEDAMIHRVDSKYGLSAPKPRKTPKLKYVGPVRTGRRYAMTADGPQRIFIPQPAPAAIPAIPEELRRHDPQFPVLMLFVPVSAPAPKPVPVPAPKAVTASAPRPVYVPAKRPVATVPGRSTTAPHPALALRSRPLRPLPRQVNGGVRTGTHRRP